MITEQVTKLREESDPATEQLLNFLTLTAIQKIELMKELMKWHGLIRIFIHPFWATHKPLFLQEFNLKPGLVPKGLTRILTKPVGSIPPIFIFEAHNKIDCLPSLVKNSGQHLIYYVPTNSSDPTPYLPKEPNESDFNHWQRSWHTLTTLLRYNGVKKIMLAGIRLDLAKDQPETDHERSFSGCVNTAMQELTANGIPVVLSNFTEPL